MTQIDELVIRIPGMAHEGSSRLANEVAQQVVAALPEGTVIHHIPELKIQLNEPQVKGTAAMADAIAEQIVRQIKQLNFNV